MLKRGFRFTPLVMAGLLVAILCFAQGAALFAQQSGCERCHTDDGLLKSLFKPTKAAPSEEGEG